MHKQHSIQRDGPKQETVIADKYCTNTDSISKSNNEVKPMVQSGLSEKKYFLSEPNYDSDKKRVVESTQQLHKDFEMYLLALGALIAHFHCS